MWHGKFLFLFYRSGASRGVGVRHYAIFLWFDPDLRSGAEAHKTCGIYGTAKQAAQKITF
jgi:hypothetical protein